MPHSASQSYQPTSHTQPGIVVRHFMKCADCALWRPQREDSVSDDFGLCPRKIFPDNITQGDDGCCRGVESKE